MANTVRVKRRAGGGASGAPSSLANAELAFSEVDDILYIGKGTGGGGGSATTIEVVGGKGAMVTLTGAQTVAGVKSFSSFPETPSSAPTTNYQVANKKYVDDTAASGGGGDMSKATYDPTNIAASAFDRANHTGSQAQSTVSSLVSDLAAKAPLASPALTGNPTAPTQTAGNNSTRVATTAYADTGLALKANIASPTFTGDVTLAQDPSSALHAVTKQYVDSLAINVGKRATVRVATTTNITISTALNNADTLDGVALATGDLVLVKDQSTGNQNGVYVVGVTPVRSTEFDTFNEHPGSLIAVQEGTANADTLWLCTANGGGTLNTTSITYSKMVIAGELLATNNLSDVANASTARGNLGLGTMATQAASAVAITGGTIDGVTLDCGTF